MKLKNIYLAVKEQFPLSRAFKNFFVTGNAWGLFSLNSHVNQSTNQPKVTYSSHEKAIKAAQSMQRKYDGKFSAYKCAFCDGYHVGKSKV